MIVQALRRVVVDGHFLQKGEQYTGTKKVLQPYIDGGYASEVKATAAASADVKTGTATAEAE